MISILLTLAGVVGGVILSQSVDWFKRKQRDKRWRRTQVQIRQLMDMPLDDRSDEKP